MLRVNGTLYAIRSGIGLKRASMDATGRREFWQAGKSVAGIDDIVSAEDIVRRFGEALPTMDPTPTT